MTRPCLASTQAALDLAPYAAKILSPDECQAAAKILREIGENGWADLVETEQGWIRLEPHYSLVFVRRKPTWQLLIHDEDIHGLGAHRVYAPFSLRQDHCLGSKFAFVFDKRQVHAMFPLHTYCMDPPPFGRAALHTKQLGNGDWLFHIPELSGHQEDDLLLWSGFSGNYAEVLETALTLQDKLRRLALHAVETVEKRHGCGD